MNSSSANLPSHQHLYTVSAASLAPTGSSLMACVKPASVRAPGSCRNFLLGSKRLSCFSCFSCRARLRCSAAACRVPLPSLEDIVPARGGRGERTDTDERKKKSVPHGTRSTPQTCVGHATAFARVRDIPPSPLSLPWQEPCSSTQGTAKSDFACSTSVEGAQQFAYLRVRAFVQAKFHTKRKARATQHPCA